MIRRIPILELKRGMFVADTQPGSPLAPPLYSVEGFIMTDTEGQHLRKKGFRYADVDEAKFSSTDTDAPAVSTVLLEGQSDQVPPGVPAPQNESEPVDFAVESEPAAILYKRCMNAAKTIHKSILTNTEVELGDVTPLFSNMVESLTRNQFALLSVSKLRTRDAYTYTHCVNVAIYSTLLGRQLGVHEEDLPELALGGFFHDIGKLFMPLEVLNFPGRFTPQQFEIMRKHSTLGLKYLEENLQLPRSAKLAASDHHERFNGMGYPNAKAGEQISFIGQVVAVADVFDALCSQRPYKEALHPMGALSLMYKSRERDFAPGYLETFIDMVGVYPTGCLVQLSNRFCAVVTEQVAGNPTRPKVVTLADGFGSPVMSPKIIDLATNPAITIQKPVMATPSTINVHEFIRRAYM